MMPIQMEFTRVMNPAPAIGTQGPEGLTSVHPETRFWVVILRSPAKAERRRISWLLARREILRGVYPELAEGLRMTVREFPDGH